MPQRPLRRKVHDLRDWTGQLDCTERQGQFEDFLMIDFVAHRVRERRIVNVQGETHMLSTDG